MPVVPVLWRTPPTQVIAWDSAQKLGKRLSPKMRSRFQVKCSPSANRSTLMRGQIQIFVAERVGGTIWNVVSIVVVRHSILDGTVRITINSSVMDTLPL